MLYNSFIRYVYAHAFSVYCSQCDLIPVCITTYQLPLDKEGMALPIESVTSAMTVNNSPRDNVFFFVVVQLKSSNIFHIFYENICCGGHWKRLFETLPMSTHNIYFLPEIRKKWCSRYAAHPRLWVHFWSYSGYTFLPG